MDYFAYGEKVADLLPDDWHFSHVADVIIGDEVRFVFVVDRPLGQNNLTVYIAVSVVTHGHVLKSPQLLADDIRDSYWLI